MNALRICSNLRNPFFSTKNAGAAAIRLPSTWLKKFLVTTDLTFIFRWLIFYVSKISLGNIVCFKLRFLAISCLFLEEFLKSTARLLVKAERNGRLQGRVGSRFPVWILRYRLWGQTLLFLPCLKLFNPGFLIPGKSWTPGLSGQFLCLEMRWRDDSSHLL